MHSLVAIVIPARLNSSRFPRKILHPIDGKPLILHVLDRAKEAAIAEVYVACCCQEVKNLVEVHGGKAIVTDPELPSGTDRVYAAVEQMDVKPEIVINLQGDNPVFTPSILQTIVDVLKNTEDSDITTPVTLQNSLENFENENTVKVVFNNMEENKPGKALYFSRSPIPFGSQFFYAHLGIYAYRYESLKKFVSLSQSYTEKTERLEQLRALQNNMNIYAVPVDGFAVSVDVESDLDNVYKNLNK